MNKLFLQGGLGNQLIQAAAARCLSSEFPTTTKLNLFKLGSLYSRLTSTTPRALNSFLAHSKVFRSTHFLSSLIDYLTFLFLLRLRSSSVIGDHNFLDQLSISSCHHRSALYLSGYFHFSQVFTNPNALTLWKEISLNLCRYQLPSTFPYVCVHMRTTDYLSKINQSLFSRLDYADIIIRAFQTASSFVPSLPVYVVTDSIEMSTAILPENLLGSVKLISVSPISDLSTLSSSQYLYMANSSFSLCAARLGSIINPSQISYAPPIWYLDPDLNLAQFNMLQALPFIDLSST